MQLLVNVDVPDLERAIGFYGAAFGLRLGRRLFGGSVAEMLGASSPIHLLSAARGTGPFRGAPSVRDYDRHWTPVHLDFAVDDVEAAVGRAVAAGATLEGEVQAFDWGRLATLADPFGHGFCLVELSTGGYDVTRTARDLDVG